MTHVAAFDPGETTGYVLVNVRSFISVDDHPAISEIYLERYGSFNGMAELYSLRSLYGGIATCVIEDYRIYPNRIRSHVGARVYTLREIGRIEMLVWEHSGLDEVVHKEGGPVRGVVFQAASMAKQRWPNKRLYASTPRLICHRAKPNLMDDIRATEHVKDAFRHLLTYLERSYGAPLRTQSST